MLENVKYSNTVTNTVSEVYLNLRKGNLKAEAFIEIWIKRVLLHCCLLLLQTLAVVLEHDFHERVCRNHRNSTALLETF